MGVALSNESPPIRHRPGAAPPAPSSGMAWRLPQECACACAWGRRAKAVDGRRDDRGGGGCGALKPEEEAWARSRRAGTQPRCVGPEHQPRATDAWAPGPRASLTPYSLCRRAAPHVARRCVALPWQCQSVGLGAFLSRSALGDWDVGHADTTTDHDAGSSRRKSRRGTTSAIHPQTKQGKHFLKMKWHDTHISPNIMVKG